jgi:hypothetical protein
MIFTLLIKRIPLPSLKKGQASGETLHQAVLRDLRLELEKWKARCPKAEGNIETGPHDVDNLRDAERVLVIEQF